MPIIISSGAPSAPGQPEVLPTASDSNMFFGGPEPTTRSRSFLEPWKPTWPGALDHRWITFPQSAADKDTGRTGPAPLPGPGVYHGLPHPEFHTATWPKAAVDALQAPGRHGTNREPSAPLATRIWAIYQVPWKMASLYRWQWYTYSNNVIFYSFLKVPEGIRTHF